MKTFLPSALAAALIASGCEFGPGPDRGGRERKRAAVTHLYTVGISLKTPMSFTRAEADSGGWKFTVDWDLARAAVFHTQDFAQLQTEAQFVAAFDLLSGFGGPGGIGVLVDMTKNALPRDTGENVANP